MDKYIYTNVHKIEDQKILKKLFDVFDLIH